jgi:hypothetical protein
MVPDTLRAIARLARAKRTKCEPVHNRPVLSVSSEFARSKPRSKYPDWYLALTVNGRKLRGASLTAFGQL